MSIVGVAYGAALGRGQSRGGDEDEGWGLTDEEYLRTHGWYAKAQKAAQKAGRVSGAIGRGIKQRQKRFFLAAGLGGTSLAGKAETTATKLPGAQFKLKPGVREAYQAELNKGLQTLSGVRQKVSTGLSTGAAIEGAVVTALLAAFPVTSAFAPVAAAGYAGLGSFMAAGPTAIPDIATKEAKAAGTYDEPGSEMDAYLARLSGTGGDSRQTRVPTSRGGGGADFFGPYSNEFPVSEDDSMVG